MSVWWVLAYSGLGAAFGAAVNPVTRGQLPVNAPGWARSPLVALAITGVLFAVVATGFGHRWELVPYGVLAVVSVPLAITDIIEQRLSSALVLPLGITLLALFAVLAVARADGASFLRAVLAMAALAGFHLVLALLLGGLGAGDVKLSAALGIVTGWLGWPAVIGMLLLAYVTASLAVLFDRLRHKAERLEVIPLGPYLIFSTFVTIVTLGA